MKRLSIIPIILCVFSLTSCVNDLDTAPIDPNKGYHGIWSHTSFRPDKSDCHPQINLIEMLKSLKK